MTFYITYDNIRTNNKGVSVIQQIRPIPTGVEFYKQMISEGYYYIDKTLLIRDLLAQKSTVTLFTRPIPGTYGKVSGNIYIHEISKTANI